MKSYHGVPESELLAAIDRMATFNRPALEALGHTLSDLGMDSLELFKFAMDLEDAVNLRLDVEAITPQSTLQTLLESLQPC